MMLCIYYQDKTQVHDATLFSICFQYIWVFTALTSFLGLFFASFESWRYYFFIKTLRAIKSDSFFFWIFRSFFTVHQFPRHFYLYNGLIIVWDDLLMCRSTYVTPYGIHFAQVFSGFFFSSLKRYCQLACTDLRYTDIPSTSTRTSHFFWTLSYNKIRYRTMYSLPVLYVLYFILLFILIIFVSSGKIALPTTTTFHTVSYN